jgi:hypothetical protein
MGPPAQLLGAAGHASLFSLRRRSQYQVAACGCCLRHELQLLCVQGKACELYGGTEAIVEIEETRAVEDFTFIWNQAEFNPITNETLCHIHFEFKDGSRLDKAFTYDWRLWSIPEVKELLEAAGFASVDVYWEAVDEDGDGTGEHRLTTREENQEGWLVLIVATK